MKTDLTEGRVSTGSGSAGCCVQNPAREAEGFSLKGCQIVAGGRSVAQTTGQQSKMISHPERVSEKRWHPPRVRTMWALVSGGLRYATTTGYYLTALQAEIRSLGFRTHSVATGYDGLLLKSGSVVQCR